MIAQDNSHERDVLFMKESVCMKKKKEYCLAALSQSRAQLYGVMTFFIMFCHCFVRYDLLFGGNAFLFIPAEQLRNLAVAAVDMFLIMSGVSLYFSFSKDSRIMEFYKRRAIRILPVVFIVSVLWFSLVGANSVAEYFKNVFLITFFTEGNRSLWFFALLIICYIVYPFVHKLFAKTGIAGLLVMVAIVVTANFTLRGF